MTVVVFISRVNNANRESQFRERFAIKKPTKQQTSFKTSQTTFDMVSLK